MKIELFSVSVPRLGQTVLAGCVAVLALTACETPLNNMRAHRFAPSTPAATNVAPSALALALKVAPDGAGLTPDSLRELNAMLNSQGRLSQQKLAIVPFSPQGQQLASRLAAALVASGAVAPVIRARPADAVLLSEAASNQWDLELQSEAMVLSIAPCQVARPDEWALHPYQGVGQLGCANRSNIARMTSDPRDLVRPRTLDGGDGRVAGAAIERYQSGQLRTPIDINFNNK
jgi:pilus assembly protein CpaD